MKNMLYGFILLAGAFLAYFPTLQNDFCFDDEIVLRASYPRKISETPRLLYEPVKYRHACRYYRPLAYFSFTLDFLVWGKRRFGYHLSNIFLCFFGGMAAFYLALEFMEKRKALLLALLFTANPSHSEAIISVFNRSQVIAGIFILLSIWGVMRLLKTQRNFWIFFICVSLILACLAKETGLTIVMLSCMTIFFHRPSRKLWKTLALLIFLQFFISIAYFVWRLKVLGTLTIIGAEPFLQGKPFWTRYFSICWIFTTYIRLFIFPFPLSCDYPISPISFHWSGLFWPIFFPLCFYAFLKQKKTLSWMAFGFFWIFLSLSLVLHFISLPFTLGERLLYPASFGFALILVCVAYKSSYGEKFLYSILCLWIILTIHRCFDWKNNDTLWKQTFKTTPNSYRALIYLGNQEIRKADQVSHIQEKQQYWKKAVSYYQQALKTNINQNNTALLHRNMAAIAFRQKDIPKRILHLEKALEIFPSDTRVSILLGDLYGRSGNWSKAIFYYKHACKCKLSQKQRKKLQRNIRICYKQIQRLGRISQNLFLWTDHTTTTSVICLPIFACKLPLF